MSRVTPLATTGVPRWKLALAGFAGHAPGLWLVYRARPDRFVSACNLVALALTLGAMALAGSNAERPFPAVLGVWLTGHLAWSLLLTFFALRGRVRVVAS